MTLWIRYSILAVLLTLRPSSASEPEQPSLEQLLVAHCNAREATTTLRARFVQTRTFALFDEKETSGGELFFAQPDRICWQYSDPDQSSTVINGEWGWSAFPDIKQIQKFELGGSQTNKILSIVGFGSCTAPLSKSFEITLASRGNGTVVLQMEPTDKDLKPYISSVDLTLDESDYLPRKIVLHERSGDLLEFEFSGLKRNLRLDATIFVYRVPKGYEVVEY
jgi:outer membrane lipoprotein-sorting protein